MKKHISAFLSLQFIVLSLFALADLAELAQQAVSPSLIVIGEVVALRQQLAWFGEQGQGQEAKSGHELKLVSLA